MPNTAELAAAAFDSRFIVESEFQDLRYLVRIIDEISDLALNGATCVSSEKAQCAVEDELMGALRFSAQLLRRQIDEAEERYVARLSGE